MYIYNCYTRNQVLFTLLQKEFQRKYKWKILFVNNRIELVPYTNLQKFILSFQNNLILIECKFIRFEKKIKNIYFHEMIKKIYQLYLQSIVMEYILEYHQESIKTLFLQSFFHLSTNDLKILRQIF